MLKVVQDVEEPNVAPVVGASLIDEIVREGARAMLAAALQAEVAAYIECHVHDVDAEGHRLVVRNGSHAAREVLTSSGAVVVAAPRVNDRRADEVSGERRRFASAILPAWCRKSPKITEVLPLLYLHGLSSNDFRPALEQFLGTSAASGSQSGLSGSVITRLTVQWQGEAKAFAARDLSAVDYVYVWADGIHVNIRLDSERLCLLVLVGVRADGSKELIALSDGTQPEQPDEAPQDRIPTVWNITTVIMPPDVLARQRPNPQLAPFTPWRPGPRLTLRESSPSATQPAAADRRGSAPGTAVAR